MKLVDCFFFFQKKIIRIGSKSPGLLWEAVEQDAGWVIASLSHYMAFLSHCWGNFLACLSCQQEPGLVSV